MDITKDKETNKASKKVNKLGFIQFQLHHIEQTGLYDQKNPDCQVQQIMKHHYYLDDMQIEGKQNKEKEQQKKKQLKRVVKENIKQDNFQEELNNLIRDPEVYGEIKETLKNINQKVNHCKLNGKLLKQEIQKDMIDQGKNSQEINQVFQQEVLQQSESERRSKLQQIRNNVYFQKQAAKRPQSALVQIARTENKQHQQRMQQDQKYRDFYLQDKRQEVKQHRLFNKFSQMQGSLMIQSQIPSQNKNIIQLNFKQRPQTAWAKQTNKTQKHRQLKNKHIMHLTQEEKQFQIIQENIDVQYDIWSNRQYADAPKEQEIFVPYGNINKKNYHINVPWSATTMTQTIKSHLQK